MEKIIGQIESLITSNLVNQILESIKQELKELKLQPLTYEQLNRKLDDANDEHKLASKWYDDESKKPGFTQERGRSLERSMIRSTMEAELIIKEMNCRKLRAYLFHRLHADNPAFDNLWGMPYLEAAKKESYGTQTWIGDMSHGGGMPQFQYRVALYIYEKGYFSEIDIFIWNDPNFIDLKNKTDFDLHEINAEIEKIKRDFEKTSGYDLNFLVKDHDDWMQRQERTSETKETTIKATDYSIKILDSIKELTSVSFKKQETEIKELNLQHLKESDWADTNKRSAKNGLSPREVPLRDSLGDQARSHHANDMKNALYNMLIQFDNLKKYNAIVYRTKGNGFYPWEKNVHENPQSTSIEILPVLLALAQIRAIYMADALYFWEGEKLVKRLDGGFSIQKIEKNLERRTRVLLVKDDGTFYNQGEMEDLMLDCPRDQFDRYSTSPFEFYVVLFRRASMAIANAELMAELKLDFAELTFINDHLAYYIKDLQKLYSIIVEKSFSPMQFEADKRNKPEGVKRPYRDYYNIIIDFKCKNHPLNDTILEAFREDFKSWFELQSPFIAHASHGNTWQPADHASEHIEFHHQTINIPSKNESDDMIIHVKRFFEDRQIKPEYKLEPAKPISTSTSPGQPVQGISAKTGRITIHETNNYELFEDDRTDQPGVRVWMIKLKIELESSHYKNLMLVLNREFGAYWWRGAKLIVLKRDVTSLEQVKGEIIAVLDQWVIP